MANRDRLTALDAGVPAPRARPARTCTWPVSSSSRARRPPYDELVEAIEARLHLVPRYRQKLAHVPLRPGPAGVGRRPALQRRATTCATPRCPRRAPTSSCATSPGGCSPSRWTAPSRCGSSSSSRGSTATASRSSRRPTTRSSTASPASTSPRCCSTPRPTPRPSAAEGSDVGARARSRRDAELLAQALLERATVPAEGARGAARAHARAAPGRSGRRASGSSASARWPGPGSARRRRSPLQRADRPAPALHVGRRRGRRASRRSRTPGRHAQRRRARRRSRSRSGASCAAAASTTDGLVLKAMVPVSVRADDAARRARQPGRGHVGAAARRASTDPEAVLAEVAEAMRGLKESGQAVGAEALTALADFAPPTIMSPGRAAAGAPALLQPRRDERPGPADPALPARAPAWCASTPSCRSPSTRRWASRS